MEIENYEKGKVLCIKDSCKGGLEFNVIVESSSNYADILKIRGSKVVFEKRNGMTIAAIGECEDMVFEKKFISIVEITKDKLRDKVMKFVDEFETILN